MDLGQPMILGPNYRGDVFGSGKELLTSYPHTENENISFSKTTGIMKFIGGDGGTMENTGTDSGVFRNNSLDTIITGDSLLVFDDYYQTQRHYSYRTYEYFDKVSFKVYKKGLFYDSYQSTLNYYIDESPSTSSSATYYTYERYYKDQQIYSSVYASTYFYAYIYGDNTKIYLKDRSSVSNGDYYVKIVDVDTDFFKLYRGTTESGWYYSKRQTVCILTK